LFTAQFFGAVNDNFLKNAMLIMVTYQLGKTESQIGSISNLAAGLFILPYFLFSTIAGQLADKFDKSVFCRWIKLWEVILMLAAWIGFLLGCLPFLLLILFFMGAQSTFFSPAKYALLPTHLSEKELLAGNVWIGGGTYLAILCGVISGGVVIMLPCGRMFCGILLTAMAVIGYLASLKIPAAPSPDPEQKIDWNFFRQTWQIMVVDIWRHPVIRRCVYSVTVFWLAGSLYITQMPLFTKLKLGGNELICTWFFVLFSIGVGIGAGVSNLVLRGTVRLNKKYIACIAGMGVFTLDIAYLAWSLPSLPELVPTAALLHDWIFYRVCLDLLGVAVCGGIWSVPLQALMQKTAEKQVLSRVIAGNNIANSFYMAAGAIASAIVLNAGISVCWIFIGIAAAIFCAAYFTTPLAGNDQP
jgi:acyl-[acyl-carrier-protein]-phospholipid O-acyltransferase/long-chain-fatty-acid--[acyl-carrier-protein] ligase